MAINSRAKRQSASMVGQVYLGPGIVPDGMIDPCDKQVIAYGYFGIAVGLAALKKAAMWFFK